jgi:DNA primase
MGHLIALLQRVQCSSLPFVPGTIVKSSRGKLGTVVPRKETAMPYVDFKTIKAAVSIEDAANILKLELKKSGNQLRGGCPACGNTDERILAITPGRNLFYCFDAKKGGDQIELVCHVTGLDVKDAAEYLAPHSREETHSSTAPPQRKEARKETVFDADAFLARLSYSDEVKARNITEADAKRFGIGFLKGYVYFATRDDAGFIAGFIGINDKGELKVPKTWLLPSNVVKLKRA